MTVRLRHFIAASLTTATLAAVVPAHAQKLTTYWDRFYSPTAEPAASKVMEELVAEYEALHPQVDVELIEHIADVNAYQAWLLTRFSAGDPPDITWQQFHQRNTEGGKNWLALNKYLDEPNPYIAEGEAGHERWADIFFPSVQAQIRAGDGNWYQVNTNWVETGFYINNEIMSQHGIDAGSWKTWGDMIDSCRKLREAGVQPIGMFMTQEWSTYQWLDDIIVTGAFADVVESWYMDKYKNEFLPWRQLAPEEFARAVKEGKFSVDDPRFDTYLKLTKDFADACMVEGFAGIPSYEAVFGMFFDQKVAMAWLGSWSAPNLADLPFDVGSGYLPPFGPNDSPHAIHETSYRVGGPSSSGQWGVTQAAVERGTADIAVDLLKFLSAPKNFQKLADAAGGFIPVVEGVSPPAVAKGFQSIAKLPERALTDPIARLTARFGTEHNRLMQSFMLGEISAEDLKPQYQSALDRAARDLCDEHREAWSWCDE